MTEKKRKNLLLGLVIILIVLLIALVVVLIIPQNSNKRLPLEKEITEEGGNKAESGMEPINLNLDLNETLETVRKSIDKDIMAIDDSKANQWIDLGEYKGLEKRVAQKEVREEYTEIWLIKISKEDQSIDLFRMLAQRVEDLKIQYQGNEKISQILENSDNITMKQQGGIVILIVSEKALEIERVIDRCM